MATSNDWQCNKRLAECLGHMFDTSISCDVTFLVGEDKDIVHAHKLILISRSPVFYAMFEGPLSEKGEITIPDTEKDIFKQFLRYLYTDDVQLTCDNVTYLLYTAKKYCVDILAQQCREFLKTSLNPDNACTLLEHAHRCSEDQIATECRTLILQKPTKCLKTTGFTDLSSTCLLSITESDDLMTSEDEVYRAVMRWSEAECKRQTLDINDVNKRQVLGDIIFSVRFPCMTEDVFKQEVLFCDILSPQEMIDIQRLKIRRDYQDGTMFKTNPRKSSATTRVLRFNGLHSGCMDYPNGNCHAISFSLSNHALFHGVGVYGAKTGYGYYSTMMKLYDENCQMLQCVLRKSYIDQTADIFDVVFDSPKHLKPCVVYTVAVIITGPKGKYGINGVEKMSVDGIDVTFENSGKSKSGTCVSFGQIPCLILAVI